MPDSLTSEPESEFVCDCEEWMRSACAGEPFYKEHEGKVYCVLHCPIKENVTDFKEAVNRKLDNEDFDFGGVWFPDYADFAECSFKEYAHFRQAYFSLGGTFSSAIFEKEAYFAGATFEAKTAFDSAVFHAEAVFAPTYFNGRVSFSQATFQASSNFLQARFKEDAIFISTKFRQRAGFAYAAFVREASFFFAVFAEIADFRFATFQQLTDFSHATFDSYLEFGARDKSTVFSKHSSLDLQYSKCTHPDRVMFNSLTLKPHWFVIQIRRNLLSQMWSGKGPFTRNSNALRIRSRQVPIAFSRRHTIFSVLQ